MSCVCSVDASGESMKLVYLLISGWFSLTVSKWYVNLSGSTVIQAWYLVNEDNYRDKVGIQIFWCTFHTTQEQ